MRQGRGLLGGRAGEAMRQGRGVSPDRSLGGRAGDAMDSWRQSPRLCSIVSPRSISGRQGRGGHGCPRSQGRSRSEGAGALGSSSCGQGRQGTGRGSRPLGGGLSASCWGEGSRRALGGRAGPLSFVVTLSLWPRSSRGHRLGVDVIVAWAWIDRVGMTSRRRGRHGLGLVVVGCEADFFALSPNTNFFSNSH